MRRIVVVSVLAGAAVAVAGCSPTPDPEPSANIPTAASFPDRSATPAPSASASEVADPNVSYVARTEESEITVLTEPGGGEEMTVRAQDVLTVPDQTPFVFLVKEVRGDWVELYLPVRPNGTTGWVEADSVTLSATTKRIEVSLDDYRLTVFDGDEEILTTEIGLGQDELPTPGGVYYIRELLQPPDPTGTYGPYAYGLSGYSPVLDEFAGGDAVIGVHGTNDPTSFGRSVSHGCIRIPNDVITQLVEEIGIPLGTPVFVDERA
ncbi:hypothetical protein Lsed01_01980 [Demequina sediminis]|uniref:L,D-TPase catalytic domain-containing protein n=1 Tax=Demequina sediminis TaxID=1930058 RepID=A0ABP9WII0_9MICO|nr:L,D-transpeptidase [Demequina sediminis]BDZ62064.1 hypothetical protein GCM10025873_18550 [Demequina sediminis]